MLEDTELKMNKTINALVSEFATIRAGRANPAILDKVTVDYYGTATPITQVGSVSAPEPRSLIIQPWDASILSAVEKAILKSEIGVTPSNDGKVIRLTFPQLTEERRREIIKTLHKKAEDSKVAVRSCRRDVIDRFKVQKKSGEITEDDLIGLEKDVQNLTDKKIKEIDDILAKKEKDMAEV